MRIPQRSLNWLSVFILLGWPVAHLAIEGSAFRVSPQPIRDLQTSTRLEREIAAQFAPVFYQGLGDNKRADFITNFDFDGDWRGDNNWIHTDDRRFQLKAYVYYSVAETRTHYFIHYAVFHARDYKGGEHKGPILSEIIREGAKRAGKYDPTGIAEETALAHENDMEGCLVVVAKNANDLDKARVVFVESLRHNTFAKYIAGETSRKGSEGLRTLEGRPLLYIEPKGHGIEALASDKQTANKDVLVYKFTGHADDPEKQPADLLGYDLLPIQTTLWSRGRGGVNATYGETHDYGELVISLVQNGDRVVQRKIALRKIGLAFVGKVGGLNVARPPWGWFDRFNREETLGLWFFNPAATIKRDFHLDESFPTAYVRLPFWAINK